MGIHALVIQKLLTTNSHIGRRIISNHLKPYLHGTRNSVAIFDSDKTLISLRSALSFITHLTRSYTRPNKPVRFLFINTNPIYDHIFDHMARLTGFKSFLSPHSQYWRRVGFLTNPLASKKFTNKNKMICFPPVLLPHCIVLVDLDHESTVINEAHRLGIPVIALVDSKTPSDVYDKIAYPIVVGQESVQFVYLMCNVITKTLRVEKGLTGTLNDTASNVVAVDADADASSEQATLKDVNETTEELKTDTQSGPLSEQATLKDANETTEELTTDTQSGPPSEEAALNDTNETTEELKPDPQSA